MIDIQSAASVPALNIALPLRLLLIVVIVLALLYPVLLLGMATVLSIGAIIQQFSEPSWLIVAILPVAGGLWGMKALSALLMHTLIKPNVLYQPNKLGLGAGALSCLTVVAAGYDSLFIWLMFSLPIAASGLLLWLRRRCFTSFN